MTARRHFFTPLTTHYHPLSISTPAAGGGGPGQLGDTCPDPFYPLPSFHHPQPEEEDLDALLAELAEGDASRGAAVAAACVDMCMHMHIMCMRMYAPGAAVLYVRATRTGLLRARTAVRTEGRGQLAL